MFIMHDHCLNQLGPRLSSLPSCPHLCMRLHPMQAHHSPEKETTFPEIVQLSTTGLILVSFSHMHEHASRIVPMTCMSMTLTRLSSPCMPNHQPCSQARASILYDSPRSICRSISNHLKFIPLCSSGSSSLGLNFLFRHSLAALLINALTTT